MTKARILADYVATGVTAAEFDFLDTTSGTPGATTFLRGDKTWQTAGGATSGMVSNVWRFDDRSSGACSIDSETITVATDAKSFSATSGRHYVVSGMQVAQPHRSGSTSIEEKQQKQYLYYGTTDRSILDTTVDTLLFYTILGIDHNGNSNRTAMSGHIFTYVASFTASSTATHYVYTAIASLLAGDIQARAYNNATYPHHTVVMEVMP